MHMIHFQFKVLQDYLSQSALAVPFQTERQADFPGKLVQINSVRASVKSGCKYATLGKENPGRASNASSMVGNCSRYARVASRTSKDISKSKLIQSSSSKPASLTSRASA